MGPSGRPSILELLLESRARVEGQGKVEEQEREVGRNQLLASVKKKRKLDEMQDEKCKFPASTECMTRGLVMKYLQQVAPSLAKGFQEKFQPGEMEVTLEEVVGGYRREGVKLGVKILKNHKSVGQTFKNRTTGTKRRKFIAVEDDVIRAAMSQGEIDSKEVAKQLNRCEKSVINRAEILKRTGGKKMKSCRFSLPEDLMILETLILPRLMDEKLSAITLTNQCVKELATQMNRGKEVVIMRWLSTLQPTLLQHHTGTLNLRVERMMANHIVENYRDYSDIRWEEVAARKEYAGHTVSSLKNMFLSKLKNAASQKYKTSDVTLSKISDYCELVYGEGSSSRLRSMDKPRLQRQQDVINYFEGKVEELGIKDFL